MLVPCQQCLFVFHLETAFRQPQLDIHICTAVAVLRRWLCNGFQGPEFPNLTFSNPQDKQRMDVLIQQRQGFKNAGMDLLAGTTSR